MKFQAPGRAANLSRKRTLAGVWQTSRNTIATRVTSKRGERMTIRIVGRVATAGIVLALTTIGSRADTIQLPTFDVVATTPLNGGEINVSQSPFAVWQT